MSTFPSYALGCYTALVCSSLMNRARDIQPSHDGDQCGSLQSLFGCGAVCATDHPSCLFKCFQNQRKICVIRGLRCVIRSTSMQSGEHDLCVVFVKSVLEY